MLRAVSLLPLLLPGALLAEADGTAATPSNTAPDSPQAAAPAQQVPATPEPPVTALPEYTVTARRIAEPASHVPSDIQVISAEQIRELGATDMTEVLQKLGNIPMQSFSGGPSVSSPALRGWSGENASQRVLVLVDGQKINPPDMGGINWLGVPLSEVESVEVIRGAQTSLYGNNAVAGVIKIKTRKGARVNRGTVTAIGGSDKLKNGRASYTGYADDFTFGANAEYLENGGWRQFSTYRTKSAGGNLGWQPTTRVDLDASGSYQDQYYELPGYLTEAQVNQDARQSTPSRRSVVQGNSALANAGAVLHPRDDDDLDLHGGFYRRYQTTTGNIGNATNLLQSVSGSPKYVLRQERVTVVSGVDILHDKLDVTVFGQPDVIRNLAQLHRTSAGGYANADVKVHEDWILSGGFRVENTDLNAVSSAYTGKPAKPVPGGKYDQNQDANGVAWTLGATWNPQPESRIFTRFDRLYRYPATDEIALYQGWNGGFNVAPFNTNLEPERGYNWEMGGSQAFGPMGDWGTTTVRATFFSQWMENQIAGTGPDLPSPQANINLPRLLRYGSDFGASWLVDPAALHVDYTIVDSRFTAGQYAGQEVPLVPNHQVTVRGDVNLTKNFSVSALYRYTAAMWHGNDYSNSRKRVPGYGLWDTTARYKIQDWLTVFGSVENVFDKHYIATAYSSTYYPGAGRTFKVGAEITF